MASEENERCFERQKPDAAIQKQWTHLTFTQSPGAKANTADKHEVS